MKEEEYVYNPTYEQPVEEEEQYQTAYETPHQQQQYQQKDAGKLRFDDDDDDYKPQVSHEEQVVTSVVVNQRRNLYEEEPIDIDAGAQEEYAYTPYTSKGAEEHQQAAETYQSKQASEP